mmetsp:Transcript_59162/g.121219  ORF Transcript_59162/g.121219 Transcript_59162/m.121219 type:complete len:272 (+) Transcript_59162:448-1263(+)
MRHIPLVVVHVPHQRRSALVNLVVVVHKLVAGVLVRRVLEGPEAHPAEVEVALPAVHVVASAVLVDGHLALGAVLRVRLQPIARLAVVHALFAPHLDIAALRRGVWLVHAAEAEPVSIGAEDLGGEGAEVKRVVDAHRVRAVRPRTPLDAGVVVDVALDQACLVLAQQPRVLALLQQLLDEAFVDDDVASPRLAPRHHRLPRTRYPRGLPFVLDLKLEMPPPAVVAEHMTALVHRRHLFRCLLPFKRVHAHLAGDAVLPKGDACSVVIPVF